MDKLKKEQEDKFKNERDFHDKTLKKSKENKLLSESLQEWNA